MKVISNDEIRRMLEKAYTDGFSYGSISVLTGGKDEFTFNEWFHMNYGDIIGEGTESSVSEKWNGSTYHHVIYDEIAEFDGVNKNYEIEEIEILDGLGNVISRHDFDISPSDCESRRHS